MIDKRQTLTIKKDESGIITDLSENLADFLRDPEALTLLTSDFLYVGYYKPFNALYVDLETPNSNTERFTVEVWNGSAWVAASARDESQGFSRNGFITWEKSAMELSIIDGENLAWVRLALSVDSSAMSVNGVNIVFTDKATILQEFYELDKIIQPSALIAKMVASRNEIMDRLDQMGYLKYTESLKYEDLTAFDLHDIYQIKSAATYLTLAKVFFTLSDSMEDHWWAKYEVYHKRAMSALQLFKLDVDLDDDGKDDESLGQKRAKVFRWSR